MRPYMKRIYIIVAVLCFVLITALVVSLTSKNANYYRDRAKNYVKQGDIDSARKAYEKTILLSSPSASLLNEIALFELKAGEFQKAFNAINKAIALDPSEGGHYLIRGNIYFKAGQISRAYFDYIKSAELGNSEADYYIKHYSNAVAVRYKTCDEKWRIAKTIFFRDAQKDGASLDYLFIGDSVAQGAWNSNLFGFKYEIIATSGLVVECLLDYTELLVEMLPKEIIIYMGGNDADGQGRQSPKEALAVYREFVIKLSNAGINIIVLGVNYSTTEKRSQEYVDIFNKGLRQIASEYNAKYIHPPEFLDFRKVSVKDNDLTYDGEHLKYKGYVNWFKYIVSLL